MFSTRLNPTKPPAAHRAVLERVGAACRELRPIEEDCFATERPNDQIASIFAKHGVLGIGIGPALGGVGTDPLLAVLAAERIGREGFGPASFFVAHTALTATRITGGEAEAKENSPDQASKFLSGGLQMTCAARLNCRLLAAAASIGVIADCLEIMSQRLAAQLSAKQSEEIPGQISQHIAQTATDLEAVRALVYAAAELKAEYDRRPESKHLELETGTLLCEAENSARRAVKQMRSRAEQIDAGGSTLFDHLPARHRCVPWVTVFCEESEESLEAMISRYYLFL